MSYRPSTPRGASNANGSQQQSPNVQRRPVPDLNRQLPEPPSSSLPNEYEIPALRRKPLPNGPIPVQIGHSRSVSHPFPSFFTGRRNEKRPNQKQDEIDSSEDSTMHPTRKDSRGRGGTRTISNGTSSKQPVTGKCMTCDSTVRWPQDVKVFRCTTCLTINDLELSESPLNNDNGAAYRKPMPISLERTRKLIDSCVDDFLKQNLEDNVIASQRPTQSETFFLSDEDVMDGDGKVAPPVAGSQDLSPPIEQVQQRRPSEPRLAVQPHANQRSAHGESRQPPFSPRRRRDQAGPPHPGNHRPRAQSMGSEVFRPLENYIADCLTGCTTLNISFFTVKPASQKDERTVRPTQSKQQLADSALTPNSEPDVFLSDLDAKMLLLGDFAENGSWWTGKAEPRDEIQTENTRDRSPERWRGIVTTRTPRINWLELAEWYRLIFHAGDDWHRRWSALRSTLSEDRLKKWLAVPLEKLHRFFMESQIHLQRSFLKATENLLKRPRRPLKNPEDCRFLLMLLANPLLSPSPRAANPRAANETTQSSIRDLPFDGSPGKPAKAARPNAGGLGRHSGIVKRILGLLAYLHNDHHAYLVTWFSRFTDAHFTSWVDLISSFVTYRLMRQINKPVQEEIDPTAGLIPSFSEGGVRHASQMHAALGGRSNNTQKQGQEGKPRLAIYGEDWQLRAAARVMSLLFKANIGHLARKRDTSISPEQRARSAGLNAKHQAFMHGQMIPISNFYNSMLDHADLIADFEAWEISKTKFSFCQYPFFLSIWAKIRILEHDARRQMESKAREAFFDSILSRKAVSQYLVLPVRRDCLVYDSLKGVSEAIGRGANDIKKGLRIEFINEEGVDAGGLRKEWFLLLVREIFNPNHGLFTYDDDSQYCYFNPFCFESSEQFFLVGVLLGLAIYNSTILDIAFPPFLFKKMLASAPAMSDKLQTTPKIPYQYTLEDLAEIKPALARGLRQLLDFDGDVQEVFCRDFVIEMERYGENVLIPLCLGGAKRPVTNANRREFVDMYVHYVLDQSVARQYEPFKRGFFTVCAGNALSLFRPEEIELLVRGSDEPLDINSLRAVATYDGWPKDRSPQEHTPIVWFWEFFEGLAPEDQRKMLSFITGSDRIPAMGATNLVIRIQRLTDSVADDAQVEPTRLPIARTCFNLIGLYDYHHKETLERKLWMAVTSSEGFGLK